MNIKMKRKYILILPAILSALCLSACNDPKEKQVTIEFMHSSVEQERQAVINQLIAQFEKRKSADRH
jgi:multiple sugar transport system substrate-binding protein